MTGDSRTPVVVAGTRFGQVYLEAFRATTAPIRLAGVLARGSERSRACAARYGVPLYRDPDELPDDIRIACVVIRGGLLGGPGTELAGRLMARGVHVLQEHPLHHDELADSLRTARRHGVIYRLNPFYRHLPPVRRFVGAARDLLRRQRPRYVDAACGFQLAYSLFDILGLALSGLRPWSFNPPAVPGAGPSDLSPPFRTLEGVLAGVPTTIRIQNELDPADPDNYAHLLHRVTIGTDAGNLTLVGTHGPVVWSARPVFPRTVADPAAPAHFDKGVDVRAAPSAVVLGPTASASYEELFATMWPAGVATAVDELRRDIPGGPARADGQYQLTLCQLWQDVSALLGPPDLIAGGELDPLSAADIEALARAGEAAAGDG
ncbi:Gfo/Idh/MocA family oxidoreductase [Micromonospora sp. NPDC049891]|uniref:Gfo/Idh/MocA family oxidoreductase n=1 Tax=Micromonospora sp. NPDC049891 TaxID=3155655 RepID=UPI0033D66CAC